MKGKEKLCNTCGAKEFEGSISKDVNILGLLLKFSHPTRYIHLGCDLISEYVKQRNIFSTCELKRERDTR